MNSRGFYVLSDIHYEGRITPSAAETRLATHEIEAGCYW